MVLEISLAVITVAFVVLVIYCIVTMKALKVSLGEVTLTLIELRKQLDATGLEAKKVIELTSQISTDIKNKIELLQPVVQTAANLGQISEEITEVLKTEALQPAQRESKLAQFTSSLANQEASSHLFARAADILELAGAGIRLWQKMKKRR